ncbi:uncharacterized protein LOC110397843 isoform X2 [Numida meleagris]|uniref:uncharacterized protein LOC110397843 isoform X2 n=1 Tax=Numida meleagris TaxID=8996 RepID=UPI000B3DAD67|nr:uncharacterized protein LOC110397843 isoform X2 [Numida meleagris]
MAAAHLQAGTSAAAAPRSPLPLLLSAPSAGRARGREAPLGPAPRVSSAARPVPWWNSAAAPSLLPVRGTLKVTCTTLQPKQSRSETPAWTRYL